VKLLIEQRSRLDPFFYQARDTFGVADISSTAGVYVTGDPITNTFLDLDILIESAPLSTLELYCVAKIMYGYSCRDIAEKIHRPVEEIRNVFQKAVGKVVTANNKAWEDCYCNAPVSKRFV